MKIRDRRIHGVSTFPIVYATDGNESTSFPFIISPLLVQVSNSLRVSQLPLCCNLCCRYKHYCMMRPFPTAMAASSDAPLDHSPPRPTTSSSGTHSQRNPNTHFYLPSPATNTDYALSRVTSRHHEYDSRRTSAAASAFSLSVPASPRSSHLHRRSRSSLAGLRNALQTYQVPPDDPDVTTPAGAPISHLDLQSPRRRVLDYDNDRESGELERPASLRSIYGPGLGQEMMDALVEIHRVLYRGREDLRGVGPDGEWDRELRWDEQGREVKRVVERWFEGDCRESEFVHCG